MARTFGRAMREVRNASADLQNEIKKSGLDVKKDLNLSAILQKTEEEFQQPLDQVMVDIKETVHYGSANLNEAADNLNETIPASIENSEKEIETNTKLDQEKSDLGITESEIKNESNG
jgi:gas vesicle protein